MAKRINIRGGKSGQILIQALFLSVIAVAFITAMTSLGISTLGVANRGYHSSQAFQIAEAGIEYYRWHLAHAPQDFKDGTNRAGSYYHDYTDKDGAVVGQFALDITAPPVGSTVVTILSTATTTADPSAVRKIRAQLAIPSLAKYATVANDVMRFGGGTEVFGAIHSNQGIRFDGIAHNIVSSALLDYNDPDHSGANEFGVHTHVQENSGGVTDNSFRPAEAPPPPADVRTDVFQAGRAFPVPAVDFTGFTANLAQLKTDAQAAGRYFGSSGVQGYRIVLKTNDTFDIYKVNQLFPAPNNCTNILNQSGWGTWSIGTGGGAQTFLNNYAIPSNGIVFAEDHIWVEGQISTARITIASGRFPENINTNTSITVNTNLTYTNYNGQDVIALIAQQNMNAGLVSADTLRIDAALLAKNGRVGRYYYRPAGNSQNRCAPYHTRSAITLYGMIGTNQRYGFAYTDGTGYQIRTIIYDANLLYGPPPSFPLTSDQYQTISWEEVR